jgi:hypothetical protein
MFSIDKLEINGAKPNVGHSKRKTECGQFRKNEQPAHFFHKEKGNPLQQTSEIRLNGIKKLSVWRKR